MNTPNDKDQMIAELQDTLQSQKRNWDSLSFPTGSIALALSNITINSALTGCSDRMMPHIEAIETALIDIAEIAHSSCMELRSELDELYLNQAAE